SIHQPFRQCIQYICILYIQYIYKYCLYIQHREIYADATLLYITNPVSGYSINWSNSQIMPITTSNWDAGAEDPLLKRSAKVITYLGIRISPNLNELFKLNNTPHLQEIKDIQTSWNILPLFLIGRISTIKMKILPKVNYLFAMTPTTPPPSWFSSLNSTVTRFYWKESNCLPSKNPNNMGDWVSQISTTTFYQTNYYTSDCSWYVRSLNVLWEVEPSVIIPARCGGISVVI
uniref:Uncharacterized protein n=1 Tax=Labrus bergylta TaxID=56723 RepID=A0A3Q3MNQ2_9LABR